MECAGEFLGLDGIQSAATLTATLRQDVSPAVQPAPCLRGPGLPQGPQEPSTHALGFIGVSGALKTFGSAGFQSPMIQSHGGAHLRHGTHRQPTWQSKVTGGVRCRAGLGRGRFSAGR